MRIAVTVVISELHVRCLSSWNTSTYSETGHQRIFIHATGIKSYPAIIRHQNQTNHRHSDVFVRSHLILPCQADSWQKGTLSPLLHQHCCSIRDCVSMTNCLQTRFSKLSPPSVAPCDIHLTILWSTSSQMQ